MLRRTSKIVKEVVDKIGLSTVASLTRTLWDDVRNGRRMRKLVVVTARGRITTLELPLCAMKGQDTEKFGVL
jgi:hypothetical protein